MKNNHFILIGNYPLDHQESMNRYSLSLQKGLLQKGLQVTLWKPVVFFALGQRSTLRGVSKWLGYLDKWVLFPLILKLKLLKSKYRDTYFHICDHSNAPYLAVLPKSRSGITCHDVLAIRGALGHTDAYCPASTTGVLLQKWILKNLITANRIACVSRTTLNQLKSLAVITTQTRPSNKRWIVIYNSFNSLFKPVAYPQRIPLLQKHGLDDANYILQVGSALPRKNRKMLIDMAHELGEKWQGKICFAGQPIDTLLRAQIEELGLSNRVICIVKPTHEVLTALYSGCTALIFPSFSEGFGWPLIEAQACGAPVIASNIEPVPEVSGGAAIYASPYSKEEFAAALHLLILNPQLRAEYIQKGFINCERFEQNALTDQFLALYD